VIPFIGGPSCHLASRTEQGDRRELIGRELLAMSSAGRLGQRLAGRRATAVHLVGQRLIVVATDDERGVLPDVLAATLEWRQDLAGAHFAASCSPV